MRLPFPQGTHIQAAAAAAAAPAALSTCRSSIMCQQQQQQQRQQMKRERESYARRAEDQQQAAGAPPLPEKRGRAVLPHGAKGGALWCSGVTIMSRVHPGPYHATDEEGEEEAVGRRQRGFLGCMGLEKGSRGELVVPATVPAAAAAVAGVAASSSRSRRASCKRLPARAAGGV